MSEWIWTKDYFGYKIGNKDIGASIVTSLESKTYTGSAYVTSEKINWYCEDDSLEAVKTKLCRIIPITYEALIDLIDSDFSD